ncbi:MAG: NnrS family protein [Magnetococcales bacterium]|nr:NnrS family protein [Magnetococcales bacterium]
MKQRIIQIIAPPDPPFTPMNFTRIPIVQRFWYGGLGAGAPGFLLGFGLWMWQHGFMIVEGDSYYLLKLWHARLQIEGFVGAFLLGFALQSGPHITGGKPPGSQGLLILFHLLWPGLLLSLAPDPRVAMLGGVLVSAAYGGAGYALLRVSLAGNPRLRVPRGLPLTAGITLMAAAPWLELDDPEVALFLLWCGPVTMALVAAQQLINNVLGGRILQGRMGQLFVVLLALSWLASGSAAFAGWGSWRMAGACWLGTLSVLLVGTDFPRMVWRMGWTAITVTLGSGFAFAFGSGWVMLQRDALPDSALHLLAAGMLTTLILGVSARVTGFFSAGAVLPDRVVSYLVILWGVVALTRALSPVLPMEEIWTVWMSILGGLLLLLWGVRTGYRLSQIRKLLPKNL